MYDMKQLNRPTRRRRSNANIDDFARTMIKYRRASSVIDRLRFVTFSIISQEAGRDNLFIGRRKRRRIYGITPQTSMTKAVVLLAGMCSAATIAQRGDAAKPCSPDEVNTFDRLVSFVYRTWRVLTPAQHDIEQVRANGFTLMIFTPLSPN